jgi:hypothetical protein
MAEAPEFKRVVAPSIEVPNKPTAPRAEDKPEHSHYKVLTDQWGTDTEDRPAPRKGDVIAAADIGPYHKWAVRNGVVKGITAKEAAARAEALDMDE